MNTSCWSTFPHCLHSCKALLTIQCDEAAFVDHVRQAFEELEGFGRFTRVDGHVEDERRASLASSSSGSKYRGTFTTAKCQYVDFFEFEVMGHTTQGLHVEVFAHSGSFCCLGRFGFCWRFPCYFMQCFADGGLNRTNLQKLVRHLNKKVSATLELEYSS